MKFSLYFSQWPFECKEIGGVQIFKFEILDISILSILFWPRPEYEINPETNCYIKYKTEYQLSLTILNFMFVFEWER